MDNPEANIALLRRLLDLIPDRLDEARAFFDDGFEWHYFNKELPQISKTYKGIDGLRSFFGDLAGLTGGTFGVRVKAVHAIGNELVVAHACPSMTMDGKSFETDAAVVWRIVDGKLAEAWDIPGLHSSLRPL